MEAFDDEREAIDQGLQHRDEVAFADALDRSHPLELRDLVNRIDMVDPFGAVPVTLMDGVDTDIAGTAFGPGFASFTNVALYRMRFVDRPLVAERRVSTASDCIGARLRSRQDVGILSA